MATALSDKLSKLVKQISGQARITEANVSDMLREVRMALLEADVALPVVRDFIARVKDKALGQEVLSSLTPGQVLVSIVQKELDTLYKIKLKYKKLHDTQTIIDQRYDTIYLTLAGDTSCGATKRLIAMHRFLDSCGK